MVSSYRFSTLVAVAPDGQYAAAALDEQDAAAAHAVAPDEQDAAAALDEQDDDAAHAVAPDEQDDAASIAPCCLPGGLSALSALAESPRRLEGIGGGLVDWWTGVVAKG